MHGLVSPGNVGARVFAKRQRKKEAVSHLHEAIAAEWQRRGVKPRNGSNEAFWEAAREAGLWNADDPESRLAVNRLGMQIVTSARETLSAEDQFLVTGGEHGRDPFASD